MTDTMAQAKPKKTKGKYPTWYYGAGAAVIAGAYLLYSRNKAKTAAAAAATPATTAQDLSGTTAQDLSGTQADTTGSTDAANQEITQADLVTALTMLQPLSQPLPDTDTVKVMPNDDTQAKAPVTKKNPKKTTAPAKASATPVILSGIQAAQPANVPAPKPVTNAAPTPPAAAQRVNGSVQQRAAAMAQQRRQATPKPTPQPKKKPTPTVPRAYTPYR